MKKCRVCNRKIKKDQSQVRVDFLDGNKFFHLECRFSPEGKRLIYAAALFQIIELPESAAPNTKAALQLSSISEELKIQSYQHNN